MKLISKVAVLFLMVFNLLSCSKEDDNQTTLEGKWEFYKEGYFYDIPENESDYKDYYHRCDTKKDYRFFYADGKMQEHLFGLECNEQSSDYKWTLKDNGNKLDIKFGDDGEIYEVLEFDGTILKVKFLEYYGPSARVLRGPNHFIFKKIK